MRIRRALAAAAAVVATGTTLMAAPAQAATTCVPHTIDFNAFAGHKIEATLRECHGPFIGQVPRSHLTSVSKPIVSYPTRVPSGLGETLKTTKSPYLYSHSSTLYEYRFTTQQGHVGVPFHSVYNFKIQVRSLYLSSLGLGVARICFVGHSCSAWQN